jgi:hypothetical protein
MPECLSANEILAVIAGTMPPDDRLWIDAHLKECDKCKQEVAKGERTFFRSTLRTTLQVIGIGIMVGGLPVLAFVLASAATLFANVGKAYSYFPSTPVRRWATFNIAPIPEISLVASGMFFAVAMLLMGWCVAALIRPRRVMSAAMLSLGTGTVAGLASFLAGIGWPMVLTLTIVPSLPDMQLLGDVRGQPSEAAEATPADQPDRLLEKYPDLTKVAEKDRPQRLMSKIIADQVTGSYEGMLWGMLFPFALFGLTGLMQGFISGALLVRGDSRLGSLLPYLEISLPTTMLISAMITSFFFTIVAVRFLSREPPDVLPWLLFFCGWMAVAIFVVAYRWPFWARWSFYLTLEIVLGHVIVGLWTIPPEVNEFADLILVGVGTLVVCASMGWREFRARRTHTEQQAPVAA